MDMILHLGAHGTATRRFCKYAKAHPQLWADQGLQFWAGTYADSAPEQVAEAMARLVKGQGRRVFVSAPDVLGTLRDNLLRGLLYPDAGRRITRIADTCGDTLQRIVLSPRSLDLYWCSAVSNGVFRGAPVPNRSALRAIGLGGRGWRDVIADIAAAAPGVEIRILPFDSFDGLPHRFLSLAADIDAPRDGPFAPTEAAPLLPELRRVLRERGQDASNLPFGMGRWNPFTNEEHAALRELYADDIMWLAAGADGLANLTEDGPESRAGQTPLSPATQKGPNNELQERHMARPG